MEEHSKTFYLKGEKTFSSLKEFAKELKDMSMDVYEHHVTPKKNDFYNWIKNSLNEEKLAKKLEKKVNKIEMELEVLRHIVHESQKQKKTIKKTKK